MTPELEELYNDLKDIFVEYTNYKEMGYHIHRDKSNAFSLEKRADSVIVYSDDYFFWLSVIDYNPIKIFLEFGQYLKPKSKKMQYKITDMNNWNSNKLFLIEICKDMYNSIVEIEKTKQKVTEDITEQFAVEYYRDKQLNKILE